MRKFTRITLTITLLIMISSAANAQRVIVSWLGNGGEGFSGDGAAGYAAKLYRPNDVCLNSAHDLIVVDMGNGRIRKISQSTGIVMTIAGGGSSTAEGVPATNASINPQYICIDGADNIYFSTDNKIRRVDAASGRISTVAGKIAAGFSGDSGPATDATLNGPQGICIDASGNLYVVDAGNNCIRKISATGTISTIAGSAASGYSGDGGPATAAELYSPIAICVNASGDVYFSDQTGSYIRKITAATGIISHTAGTGSAASGNGGPAADAGVGEIWGICVDDTGNIYCDDYSCACRKISMSTGIINVVVGSLSTDGYNGDGMDAMVSLLNYPHGLCIDAAGNIFIADINNVRIRKAIQLTHTPSFAFGKGVTVTPCPGIAISVNRFLGITDLDAAQLETWSVVSTPTMGTLSGFPYTGASNGTDSITTPAGLFYTSVTGYTGADSFRVRVTDGTLSDTVTVYLKVTVMDPGTVSGPSGVCAGSGTTFTATLGGGTWSAVNADATIDASSGDVMATTAGVDTILYTVTGTCTMNITKTLTINPLPDAGTISGPSDLCLGSTVHYTDPVAGGYWGSSYGNATVDASGIATGFALGSDYITYYTEGTGASAGCYGTAILAVTVDLAPYAGAITGTSTVSAGSYVSLSDLVTGGVWSTTNAAISTVSGIGEAYGVSGGTDSIVYSVTNSCGTASTYFTFTVLPGTTTYINNVAPDARENMIVTPNPSTGNFSVKVTSATDETVMITVTNLIGEKVTEVTGNTNKQIGLMLKAPAGVYLLNTSTLHESHSLKVVKE